MRLTFAAPGPGMYIRPSKKPPVKCAGVCDGWIMDPLPCQVRAHHPSCGEPDCERHITKLKFRRLRAKQRTQQAKQKEWWRELIHLGLGAVMLTLVIMGIRFSVAVPRGYFVGDLDASTIDHLIADNDLIGSTPDSKPGATTYSRFVIWVTLRNRGMDSSVDKFNPILVLTNGTEITGVPAILSEGTNASTRFGDLKFKEQLHEVSRYGIPRGRIASGFMIVQFNNVTPSEAYRAGNKIRVQFTDTFGKQYNLMKEVTGVGAVQ